MCWPNLWFEGVHQYMGLNRPERRSSKQGAKALEFMVVCNIHYESHYCFKSFHFGSVRKRRNLRFRQPDLVYPTYIGDRACRSASALSGPSFALMIRSSQTSKTLTTHLTRFVLSHEQVDLVDGLLEFRRHRVAYSLLAQNSAVFSSVKPFH